MASRHVSALLAAVFSANDDDRGVTARQVLDALALHPQTASITAQWVQEQAKRVYTAELRKMTASFVGWHFSARNATEEQLQQFDIEATASQMETRAPLLWGLLSALLTAEPDLERRRMVYLEGKKRELKKPQDEAERVQAILGLDDDEFWYEMEDGDIEMGSLKGSRESTPSQRRETILRMVRTAHVAV